MKTAMEAFPLMSNDENHYEIEELVDDNKRNSNSDIDSLIQSRK